MGRNQRNRNIKTESHGLPQMCFKSLRCLIEGSERAQGGRSGGEEPVAGDQAEGGRCGHSGTSRTRGCECGALTACQRSTGTDLTEECKD